MPTSPDDRRSGDNPNDAIPATDARETVSLGAAPENRQAAPIPSIVGNVRVGEEIGRGGMGIVFHGWDSVLHRRVAVKFLPGLSIQQTDPQYDRFFGGARAEAAVKQPNIVTVFDAGQVQGVPYLVMEHIDGPSLRALIQPGHPLPLAVAVGVLGDVAEAVRAMHQRNIIHRDLKPGNVLLDCEGRVYVTDFGLASLQRRFDSGVPAGTPAYMAPEMFEGRASPQSDVYAMGIMLFELLTGHLPFGGDFLELHDHHAGTPLPVDQLPTSVPDSLVAVVERATHKKELFRHKTAEHFHRALRDALPNDDVLRKGAGVLKKLVLRLRDQERTDARATEAEEPSAGAYFERLGQMAEGKRTDRPEPLAESPDGRPEQEGHHDKPALIADVTCVLCAYNLRGLSAEKQCPECSEPVVSSLRRDRLLFSDQHWLALVVRGQTWIQASIPVYLVFLVVIVPAMFALGLRTGLFVQPEVIDSFFGWEMMLGLPILTCLATLLVGVFLSTSREHGQREKKRLASLRLASRACTGTAFVLSVVLFVRLHSLSATNLLDADYPFPALTISWLTTLLLSAIVFLQYLTALAARVSDRRLTKRTHVASLLFPSAVVLFVAFLNKGLATMPSAVVLALPLSVLWVWLEMGAYRQLAKRAIAAHVPYDTLFGGVANESSTKRF